MLLNLLLRTPSVPPCGKNMEGLMSGFTSLSETGKTTDNFRSWIILYVPNVAVWTGFLQQVETLVNLFFYRVQAGGSAALHICKSAILYCRNTNKTSEWLLCSFKILMLISARVPWSILVTPLLVWSQFLIDWFIQTKLNMTTWRQPFIFSVTTFYIDQSLHPASCPVCAMQTMVSSASFPSSYFTFGRVLTTDTSSLISEIISGAVVNYVHTDHGERRQKFTARRKSDNWDTAPCSMQSCVPWLKS